MPVSARTKSRSRPALAGPWALHPDGSRIAAIAAQKASEQTFIKQDKVVIFLNFFEELRRVAGGS